MPEFDAGWLKKSTLSVYCTHVAVCADFAKCKTAV